MNTIIEIIKNYEGIIGALLGVIVTTILNEYLKSKGKINFYFLNFNRCFKGRGILGEYCEVYDVENADSFEYEFEIQIYNSSDVNKIIREFEIEFICIDNRKIYSTPHNKDTIREYAGGFKTDELKILNLKPKEIIDFNICGYIWDEEILKSLAYIRKVNLIMKDSNNKLIKKVIKDFTKTS